MSDDATAIEPRAGGDGDPGSRRGPDVDVRAEDGFVEPSPLASELPVRALDDQLDRSELRGRYYGLLQELRVILPGVQVLVAFLLTAPFSQRFEDLDSVGRASYLVALVTSMAASICFLTPTAYHRAGGRRGRSSRLQWAVRTTRAGLILLAVAMTSAMYCVTRFVFYNTIALALSAGITVMLVALWLALPALTGASGGRPRRAD